MKLGERRNDNNDIICAFRLPINVNLRLSGIDRRKKFFGWLVDIRESVVNRWVNATRGSSWRLASLLWYFFWDFLGVYAPCMHVHLHIASGR